MATTLDNAVLLDTNTLVYSTVKQSPFHAAAREKIQAFHSQQKEMWVSRQILREYLAVLIRPRQTPSRETIAAVIADVRKFEEIFKVADDGSIVTANLLQLLSDSPVAGKRIHDANIVATMRAYGIGELLTHNTADFVQYAHLIKITPLVDSGIESRG